MRVQVQIEIEPTATREQLLKALKDAPNGCYCVAVCRECGAYRTSPNGDFRTCRVVVCCAEHAHDW